MSINSMCGFRQAMLQLKICHNLAVISPLKQENLKSSPDQLFQAIQEGTEIAEIVQIPEFLGNIFLL